MSSIAKKHVPDIQALLAARHHDPFAVLGKHPQGNDEIVRAFSELVNEEPEAVELIRGRTFARALH